MKKIKREIKLLYTFIIVFIVCAFLLLFNIVLILGNSTKTVENNNFEEASTSVVNIQAYSGNTLNKQGSGFIYKIENDKAYILTNNHVVDNTNNIKILITEDISVEATLLGQDKYLDVAVLTIQNNKYKALKLNKKNNLKIGDTVYTIGTPIDKEFFNTTSSGIISKTSRLRVETNANEDILMDMIQTDIITNPGNSGGPLLNEKIEVIGICTSIIETNNISGISFAVPMTHIINKLPELETKGYVSERKISNIKVVDVKDGEALYKEDLIDLTKESYGVVVLTNDKETSLKKGDIILEIDDNKIKDYSYYKHYLNIYAKGTEVSLTIKRNDKIKVTTVTLK